MSRGMESGIDLVFESASAAMTPEVARWLSEFRPGPKLAERLEDLAERNTEGQLTEQELDEYSALVELGDIFSILRLRADSFLANQNGA